MNTLDTIELIGRQGRFTTNNMQFDISIKNVRSVFGRIDYLIMPMSGSGETWVSADRVKVQ